VHPSLPARNIRELIALAKGNPGGITFGSSGQGAIVHLTTEVFLDRAGIRMTHVPYRGGAPALTDVIAGQISMVFATPQTSLPHVKAQRVRAPRGDYERAAAGRTRDSDSGRIRCARLRHE
jgi:tripartite-type tricarboxylate transporter receptor subunit TctC